MIWEILSQNHKDKEKIREKDDKKVGIPQETTNNKRTKIFTICILKKI